jgi:hypothetical protein
MFALVFAFAVSTTSAIAAAGKQVTVNSAVFFNPTGILASPGQTFTITASGTANLSEFDGPYDTNPDGTIVVAPPLGSGSSSFFTNYAAPVGVVPVVGSSKIMIAPYCGFLCGAPYGALVAGFSPIANPSSFADFPNGFTLVGSSGTVVSSSDGYLFLGVNDFDNTWDNVGSYAAVITDSCPASGPCIKYPSDGATPQSQFIALSGTGTAVHALNVLVNGASVGSVVVDSGGNWEALPYILGSSGKFVGHFGSNPR